MHFVKAQLRKGTRVALQTECNVLFSDLSQEHGGKDEGFHPCELLLASINTRLIHSIRDSVSASGGEIKEIIVTSQWEGNHAMPIVCTISVDGESISYNKKELRYHLYHTSFCKIFHRKSIKIKFIKPKL